MRTELRDPRPADRYVRAHRQAEQVALKVIAASPRRNSFQYGASHPGELVATAAEHGMDTLALTDRNGLYGAVRFAKACLKAGISPVVGVDLAVGSAGAPVRRPTAARGGQLRDERLPRAVVLASSRRGLGTLCQLITHVHLSGERSDPVATVELIAAQCAGRDAVVLLGADSRLGGFVATGDPYGFARQERANP
ncbi:PHP domain-containing protein [Ornithinimicrobium panacihumi]|uniref:PHP domain-containing protein n=1 Tax=Ornithinimicrobium panacihumi TaxID=2008449 RepID=UPI003F8A7593